jgi:hypothetical protein
VHGAALSKYSKLQRSAARLNSTSAWPSFTASSVLFRAVANLQRAAKDRRQFQLMHNIIGNAVAFLFGQFLAKFAHEFARERDSALETQNSLVVPIWQAFP